MKFKFNNNEYELILLSVAGSHLYGNSRPTSDVDYRGVFVASNDTKLGLIGKVEQVEGKNTLDLYYALVAAGVKGIEETTDIVLYELNRFCELAIDNNPNIMDLLCYDYTNPSYTKYINSKGIKLLESKHLFLSSKLKHTFSGYAMAQLKRIKGHNKWINQFPHTDVVLARLQERFDGGYIDFDWICDNFGGPVAEKITKEKPQSNTKLNSVDTWEEFCTRYNDSDVNFNEYRLPRLISFCHPKDLKAKPLKMTDLVYVGNEPLIIDESSVTIGHFLNKYASFRTHSPSMLTVYTDGKGIFSKEGNLKSNDPEVVGNFVCLLAIDHNNYKATKDHINAMWDWKCKRNEKRSELEEKFGYDTKHASHLVRLMEGCKDILDTGVYTPTLTGDRLKFVNDVRNGEYAYEWVVEYAEKLDADLDVKYKTTSLQKAPNTKKINEVLLDILK